jgi:hypothetical protein
MLKIKFYYILIFYYLLFSIHPDSFAQTLEGTTGLFFIPTAEMQLDKQIIVGMSYMDKSLISFSGYQRNAVTPYFSFTFLPFVELGGKITRLIRTNVSTQGIGDRTISARLRLYNGSESYYPSIVIGLHDIAGVYGGEGAIHNNALYVVGSKVFLLNSQILNSYSAHLGYGFAVINARTHNFVGLFGGIDLKFFNALELISEYDGTYSNGGIRVKLFDHISLLGGFLRWKYFSGGAGVSWRM